MALTDDCRHILVFVLPYMAGGNSPKSYFQYKTVLVSINAMSDNKELVPMFNFISFFTVQGNSQYCLKGALKIVLFGCWKVPVDCGHRAVAAALLRCPGAGGREQAQR